VWKATFVSGFHPIEFAQFPKREPRGDKMLSFPGPTPTLESQPTKDNRRLLIVIIEVIGITISRFSVVLLLAYVAHETRLAIADLAGKATTTDLALRVMSNVNAGQVMAWLSCIGGLGYGELQRRAKNRVIRSKGTQIKKLESRIDPDRESSQQ